MKGTGDGLNIFEQCWKKDKYLYRFFVRKQFLPDLVKVLSILPQPLDKLFLNEKKNKQKEMITAKEENKTHSVSEKGGRGDSKSKCGRNSSDGFLNFLNAFLITVSSSDHFFSSSLG